MSAGLPLNTSIGPYRVIDYVGAGGMGTVYRVSHRATGRVAAAKVMSGGAVAPRALERFHNEARILQALSHPSISEMYELLQVDGAPCLVMEYVDGETLEQLLRMRGPFPVADAVRILASLADAVGYIHQRGVIHRDLKTNNVKIDSRGAVKLLDFGIATAEGAPRLTSTGNVVGTLMSLAPEQLRTGHAEPRSDIWALGVLFYELLTGRAPFDGGAPGYVGEKIMKGAYSPASTLRSDLPREIDRILSRCLRVRPEDRYATAEALLTDLRALSSGERRVTPISGAEILQGSGEFARTIAREWRVALSGALATAAAVFLFWAVSSPSPKPPNRETIPVTPRTPVAQGSGTTLGPGERPEPAVNTGTPVTPTTERPSTPSTTGVRPSAASTVKNEGRPVSLGTLIIRVVEGPADVYIDNVRVGTTPYTLEAPLRTEMQLLLKRPGCDDLRRTLRLEEGMGETFESMRNCRSR